MKAASSHGSGSNRENEIISGRNKAAAMAASAASS